MVLPWTAPVARLRQELGLPPGRNPIFEGQHSPLLTLAFWWEEFGRPQPDWPKSARVVGFPYYDRKEGQGMPPELEAFLQSGSPPLVFTLGSAAVMDAGDFFEVSIRGALRANRRAVLLTGPEGHNPLPNPLPKGIIAVPYAPYSELFFRACAIVHSGGVGTTAQALRAGRPQLIVPFSHDQFDNAARVARLGAGRVMPRHRYRILHVGADLMRMTNDTPYQEKAKQVAQRMEGMDGARAACDAIESVLYSPRSA
jgi:UDP:flavonoid glycosyltransferase YjiC (YdhE family)